MKRTVLAGYHWRFRTKSSNSSRNAEVTNYLLGETKEDHRGIECNKFQSLSLL